jgi:glycosyltransferase involved in cell wall biosynthesis
MVLRMADRVIVETPTGVSQLRDRLGIESCKIRQIYSGIDYKGIEDFMLKHTQIKKRNDEVIILSAAAMCKRKNQLALVEAAPRILERYPRARFIFCGMVHEKEYFRRVQHLVSRLGLLLHVEFKGEIPQSSLYELFSCADVFVFVSLSETQGLALLEAMAFGVPVVASRLPPIENTVDSNVIFVNPTDSEEIASAICRVLGDEHLSSELSARGRSLAKFFSWEKTARDTVSVYERLVQMQSVVMEKR